MNDLFFLTLLVIFLATIGGAVLRRLAKDKCLKLLHDHHVTYLADASTPLWGDLVVSAQGLELEYDAAHVSRTGLVKTSFLVFPDEWKGMVALCRCEHGLTDAEKRARAAQVRRSFRPSLPRRLLRMLRNFFNMVRDAITKAFSLFVGRLAAAGTMGQAVGSRGKEVDELGKELVGTISNAYEPLLERHVGRPVVVRFKNPEGAAAAFSEFPGYLVDYTEEFLAVFNVVHDVEEKFELEVDAAHDAGGLAIDFPDDHVRIRACGDASIVVERVEIGPQVMDLGITLLPGCSLSLGKGDAGSVRLRAFRTRRIDLVCPRSRARVRFGSDEAAPARPAWAGAAPAEAAEDDA